MRGSVQQIMADGTAPEPAGACRVFQEVERARSNGDVDENMDETNYSDMESVDDESDEGSDYGTSQSSSSTFCRN